MAEHRKEEGNLRQARERYLHQIARLRSEAQRSGYEEGLALAARTTVWTQHKAQLVYRDAERNMVELMLTALEKIIGTLPAEEVTPKIALKVLGELRRKSGRITVHVHPEMVGVVTGHLDEWNDESATGLTVHAAGDAALGLLDCRLDCGENVIDAGLSVQLGAVRTALNEIVSITSSQ